MTDKTADVAREDAPPTSAPNTLGVRLLKFAVAFMGILLLVGVAVIIGTIVIRATKLAPKPNTPRSNLVGSNKVGSKLAGSNTAGIAGPAGPALAANSLAALDAEKLRLIYGAEISLTSLKIPPRTSLVNSHLSGDRLKLLFRHRAGLVLLTIDTKRAKIINVINLGSGAGK